MSADEQRIRELAYQIWQSEGCPDGQEVRHWEMACKLAEAEQSAPEAKPAARTRTRRTTAKPAEDTTDSAGEAPMTSDEPVANTPAKKPRATRASTRTTDLAPKGDTQAEAGTPQAIKKPRATRTKKTMDS